MTTNILTSIHGNRIGLDANDNLVMRSKADGRDYVVLKNPTSDATSPIVHLTGSAITLTAAAHAGKTLVVDDATAQTLTLPAATGTGNRYNFILGATKTGSQIVKVANGTDAFNGFSQAISDDGTGGPVKGFIASAGSDDTITLNGTTTGGYVGDEISVQDIGAGVFHVKVEGKATGTEATPFSATV